MHLFNQIKKYRITILVTIAILYLSFAPPSSLPKVHLFQYADKLIHVLMYSGLTMVLCYDFFRSEHQSDNRETIAICGVYPVLLGGIVELLQATLFAPRTAEWSDWFSDIVGVLLGWLIYHFIIKKILLRINERRQPPV